MLDPATLRAIWRAKLPHTFHRLDTWDLGAYGRLFRRLWAKGETFIICEQDVVPTKAQLLAILTCDHDWCAYNYADDRYPPGPMFGLARFGAPALLAHPLAAERALILADEQDREVDWANVDNRVARDLKIRGLECQFHVPPVRHAHPG
jgi:hypothetical protein